jgi:hypothetical protein
LPPDLTVAAKTEDAQAVTSRMKVVLNRDLVLLVLDDFTVELDEQSTISADQMIVMLVIVEVLVPRNSVTEAFLPGKPTLREKLEGPVDGRETDVRKLLLDDLMKFFGTGVSLGLKEDVEDRLPLCRPLEAGNLQMLKEDFLFLLHGFAGF